MERETRQPSILEEASSIVDKREQEADRKYGPFVESMHKVARIASELSSKSFDARDVFNIMIALKLTRESYSHKRDNLLDAVAYIAGLEQLMAEVEESEIIMPKPKDDADTTHA